MTGVPNCGGVAERGDPVGVAPFTRVVLGVALNENSERGVCESSFEFYVEEERLKSKVQKCLMDGPTYAKPSDQVGERGLHFSGHGIVDRPAQTARDGCAEHGGHVVTLLFACSIGLPPVKYIENAEFPVRSVIS